MNMKLKSIVTALALAASFSAFAADPIKIGLSGPFTGGSSPMGVSMRDGVKLAAAEINAKGGVLGRKIELIERDDQADNGRGVQVAQELINKEGVVATVGFINTGVSLAAQRFYEEAKIPVINNVATGSLMTKQFLPPDFADNYVFRTSANDTIQSSMIVEEALDVRKFKKVAILADSTNYGQLGRADLEKALAAKGITAGRRGKVQHQGRGHDRAVAEVQGSRCPGDPDLRHRTGAGADRQWHGKAGLESADDRKLDAVHG